MTLLMSPIPLRMKSMKGIVLRGEVHLAMMAQAIGRIIELKEYIDEKAFKLAILKLNRYASLRHETLKKSQAKETKSKFKTWSKLKKHMERRFLAPSSKQELYLKITS